MAVPARPAAGAVVATDWGQVVHDTAVALDIQSGRVTIVFSASAVSSAPTVTFPRPFAAAPVVIATVGGPTYPGVNINVGVASVTPTNCLVQAREVRESALSGNNEVEWIAIGPRA
jgi:hypothetical protein